MTALIRYFCEECNGKVSPWDGFAMAAKMEGTSQDEIRVLSENKRRFGADPANPQLLGWCWSCRAIVETIMLDEQAALRLFLRSVGVQVHVEGRSEKARLRNLYERLHPTAYAV